MKGLQLLACNFALKLHLRRWPLCPQVFLPVYLLVPERRVVAPQRQVARRIATFTVAAVVIATAVGFWLSTSISRPVRKLADRMDHLARGEEEAEEGPSEPERLLTPSPASELVRLTRSFDELLRRLASARRQLERSARLATLGQLADSVVSLLAGRCEHAGVTVQKRYGPDAPAGLAEPGRIRQVMLNLMLNAVDAMPHGGRMVLSVRRAAGGAARLEVADAGGGVKVTGGADIFEPFVTTKPQGIGLGLYIRRQAVEAFAGRIGYQPSPEGSTFWFELPAAP